MSENEKDPPLADKPKLSSLTDFEIKALKLQKEGKLDELQQEIEAVSGKPVDKPEDDSARDSEKASVEEMRVYENLVQKVKNPISLDKVPPRIRKEIEEGLALLKDIVSDKERFEKYREMHNSAFKKQKEKDNPFKPPVLPEELKSANSELKNKPSGDVSTKKSEQDVPKPPPKKEDTMEDKISFINDINTDAASAYKPAFKTEEDEKQEMNYRQPEPENSRPTLDLITNCQHCGWDLKKNDLVTVTEDDKQDFVQSILGGIRFKKIYSLFDDKYKITFRALTSKESDIAYRQIVIDGQKDFQGRVLGGTDFYWRNLQAYRMVMSLESIESIQYGRIEVPTIDEADIDGTAGKHLQEKLVPFLNYILDTYLPLESIRSVVGHAYFEFQSLCDKLQVMAESPTFWKAIE